MKSEGTRRARALVAVLAAGAVVTVVGVFVVSAPPASGNAALREYTKPRATGATSAGTANTSAGTANTSSGTSSGTSSAAATVASPLTTASVGVVKLSTATPKLTLSASLAKPATLVLTLLDVKGKVLATWSKSVRAGKVSLSLPLPAKARKAGKDTLRISTTSKSVKPKSVPVSLRA